MIGSNQSYAIPRQGSAGFILQNFVGSFTGSGVEFQSYPVIIKWHPLTEHVGGQMKTLDELNLASMTDADRLAALRAMAGAWENLEEDDGSTWGFFDWEIDDQVSAKPLREEVAEIERELAGITDEERLRLIISAAGTWNSPTTGRSSDTPA